jgi:tetratricopeptide (TPR) repeat protein
LSSRFSYTHVSELLPTELIAQIENLGKDIEPIQHWEKTVKQLAERHPQIVLAAKKLIYEEDMAEAGCELLAQIGSPRSFAVLRKFGLGQVGDDQNRTKALMKLLEAGEIKNGTRVDFWRDGTWTEIELRHILVTDEDDRPYNRQVLKTLDQGLEFYRRNQLDRSEKAYLRALELEPRAKEAYNNLATIYANRGEHDQSMVMLRKALEIDPLYIIPRCNLANFLIGDKRLDEAVETLKPLDAIERATPQAMAQLSYVRARIALLQDNLDLAQQMAKTALQFDPQFEAAGDLLDRIETVSRFQSTFSGWGERDRIRREQARKKLQQKITHPAPTLAETLSLYSKEILVAVAREWDLPSGWSALKKAPLFDLLYETMLDLESVSGVLARLGAEDRAALNLVLDRGGVIAWEEFSAAYDNDLDASPYWQYHQPETIMGKLRARCLLVETTVAGKCCLAVPVELRPLLSNLN